MNRRIGLLSALVLALGSLAACGETTKKPECSADADCKDGKVCINETCQIKPIECATDADCANKDHKFCSDASKCEWACKADADCGAGMACAGHVCKEVCSTCKAGEFCFNAEKCIPKTKACQSASDKSCGADSVCLQVSDTDFACFINCDTKKNTGKSDPRNPACWNSWGECWGVSQTSTAGVCFPPMSNTQERGQPCGDYMSPELPSFNDCKDGLLCVDDGTTDIGGVCHPACDPKKNTDPTKASPNPACESAHYCIPLDATTGVCDPTPSNRNLGDTCGGSAPSSPDYGNCTIGNVCAPFTQTLSLCVKSCNPATAGSCDAGYSCEALDFFGSSSGCILDPTTTQAVGESCEQGDPRLPTWNSCVPKSPCLAGVCGPLRTETRTVGEACLATDPTKADYNACTTDLTCYQNKCAVTCDPAAPTTCANTELCFEYDKKAKKAVCQAKCDTNNGVTSGTECSPGFYCSPDMTNKPGMCKPLPAAKQGTVLAGKSCSNYTESKFCDGSQGLYCPPSTLVCTKACDPHAGIHGNADCQQGEDCYESKDSFKGGTCAPTATQALGQACSSKAADNKLCQNGLYCDSTGKVCVTACNPASSTPICEATDKCVSSTSTPVGGYCKLVPTQTRAAGETCLGANPADPSYHDCLPSLVCNTNLTKPVCVTPLAQYSACSDTTAPCATAQECVGVAPNYYCLDKCVPGATPSTCPANFECVGIDPYDPTAGACIQTCTAKTDCTHYGTQCKDPGIGAQYCL